MKKFIPITFLLLCLAGCGKDETPIETQPSIQAIQPTETQPMETVPVEETAPDLIINSLDDLPITEIEILTVDENGEITSQTNTTDEIGGIEIRLDNNTQLEDFDINQNQSNTEIKTFSELAEDYATSEINNPTPEKLEIDGEDYIITDEMHDELQAEIDKHNKEQADALLEKYGAQLEEYRKN